MIVFLMILLFAIQSGLCFRVEKRQWRLLPLAAGLILELGSWAVVFLVPDPTPNLAVAVMSLAMAGLGILGGVSLAWFVYAVIRSVQKLIRQ